MKRRAWSLLDMLVALTLMSVILSGSSVILATLFHTQRSLGEGLQQQAARTRLGMELRGDAHLAVRAKCEDDKSCELLLAGDKVVRYAIGATTVQREVREGEAIVHRETFPLSRVSAKFAIDTSQDLPLVQLRLEPAAEERKYALPQRSALIEAAVGASISPRKGGSAP